MTTQALSHLRIATQLVDLLDRRFSIGGVRVGLDALLGLIPGVGDLIAFGLSLYIVWVGVTLGLPQEKIHKMVANVVIDLALGLVPIAGDIADVFFKANVKNLRIIQEAIGAGSTNGRLVE